MVGSISETLCVRSIQWTEQIEGSVTRRRDNYSLAFPARARSARPTATELPVVTIEEKRPSLRQKHVEARRETS